MSKHHSNKSSKRLYRQVAIAALASSGILQPLLPVLAAGTAANTTISNTATATYENDAGTKFDATSNTVSITVAPVSGITAKPTGINDKNGGAVEQNDELEYTFDVKNVGNVTAGIYIPNAANVKVQNFAPTDVFIKRTTDTDFVNLNTFTASGTPVTGYIVPGIGAEETFIVKVVGRVPTSGVVAGDNITVTLGNTGLNDNSAATQNVIDGIDNPNADEVRTAFTLNSTDPAIPANNKEASASQFIKFATSATPQAFALIKKTVGNVAPGTVAGNDDEITYNLDLSVLSTSPSGSLTPAALEGTNIRLEGSTEKRILVSDAVPTGTVLKALPTAPTDWAVVYSTDAVETTLPIATVGGLPAANWILGTTPPANLASVKRIGYIYTGTPGTLPTGYTLPAPKFAITVITSGLPLSGGTVSNIAQVFGQTQGDASGKVVYDESGDANASNFDDIGNPGPAFDPTSDTGKADPTTQGVDGNGNSTGAGIKGEAIQTIINGTVAPTTDSIFNGPNGFPTAVGPTDVNDDFTNASTAVPANSAPGVNIDETQSASFTNTVNNPPSATATLSNVTVQPIAPSQAEIADGITTTGQYGTNSSIPLGTIVVIKDNATAPTKTATYTYTADPADPSNPARYTFNLTSGTPVNFGGLAPNASVTYVVEVTLPANSVTPLTAVAIPVIAFPDNDPTSAPGYTGESTNNITLNRVYTGYVRLLKEARILDVDKTTPIQDWTSAPTLTSRVAPGQYIEYRITYQNISSPAAGTGNVILNARNFTLIEDGTGANSWATNTLHQQSTIFSRGTVNYFTGSTLIANLDPIDGRDVTRYENVVSSPLAPNELGTFKFRRLVK